MISLEKALLTGIGAGVTLGAELIDEATLARDDLIPPDTRILDGRHLAALRVLHAEGHAGVGTAVRALTDAAARIPDAPRLSVVDKPAPAPSGDPHDYLSLAKYWWPDPDSPGGASYVRKDGAVNPACYGEAYDIERLTSLAERSLVLALAAYLSGEKAYAESCGDLIRAWHLDPKTRQNPHFAYAQVVPGRDECRPSKIVEARHLISVCEAARLANTLEVFAPQEYRQLQEWYASLTHWLRDSESGRAAARADNNIGFWHDAEVMAFADFAGLDDIVDEVVATSVLPRIERQIAPDGALPAELKRARPHDYVAFTLLAMSVLDSIGRTRGHALWTHRDADGRGFQAVQDWLNALSESELARAQARLAAHRAVDADCVPPPEVESPDQGLLFLLRLLAQANETHRQSLSKLNAQLEDRNDTIVRQAAENEKQRRELGKLKGDLDMYREKSRAARSELKMIKGSLSWRITAPLRHAARSIDRLVNATRRAFNTQRVLALLKRIVPERLRRNRIARAIKRRLSPAKRSRVVTRNDGGPPPKPAPAPDIDALKAEYREKGLDKEADTFVLYRIIGNDLVPRHRKGQSRENLQFILDNEPQLPGCEKRWVVNRIVDPEEERAIVDLLERHGQSFTHVPFDWSEYARRGWALEDLPFPGFLSSEDFENLDPLEKIRAVTQVHRHKNTYVMNNNGARNIALEDGRGAAKWVLPWDGNCFVTAEAWAAIKDGVLEHPYLKYFTVPMSRVTDNRALVEGGDIPEPTEEPQLIFRRDAGERFDEDFPYGRRPKVELFWRLGIPGDWMAWRNAPWDLPYPKPSPEAGQVGTAGWVARLFSGVGELEQANARSFKDRGVRRAEAILTSLQRLDESLIGPRLLEQRPMMYDESALDRLSSGHLDDAVGAAIRATAEAALARGPYSVVDKTTLPPSGDPHDYWHPAPYWWPNPKTKDGLPYVWRDGERVPGTRMYEPESEKYDRTRLQRLFDDTTALALAWRLDGEQRYATHGASLIRTWFLDPETRMTPHLDYAQVRMGHGGNRGQSTGIIEMKDVYYFLDAVRLLARGNALSEVDVAGLKSWFRQYLDWVIESPQGRKERTAANNHGTLYDLQVAAIAAFLEDAPVVIETLRRAQDRIGGQFAPDGSQPHELARTNTAHYCAFNLQSWVNLGRFADRCGVDLWSYVPPAGGGIKRGLEWFLNQYTTETWPYSQAEPFDADRLVPLRAAYRARYGAAACDASGHREEFADAKPVYFPHDGIPPYWLATNFPKPRPLSDRPVILFPHRGASRTFKPSGATISMLELARGLSYEGFEPIILFFKDSASTLHHTGQYRESVGSVAEYVARYGLKAVTFDVPYVGKDAPSDETQFAHVRRYINRWKYMIDELGAAAIHTNDAATHGTVVTACEPLDIAHVWHERGLFQHRHTLDFLSRRANLILTISEYVKGLAPPNIRDRCIVLPNPVRAESTRDKRHAKAAFSEELGIAPSTYLVAMGGNANPRKRWEDFCRIAQRLVESDGRDSSMDFAFVALGDGAEIVKSFLDNNRSPNALRQRLIPYGYTKEIYEKLRGVDLVCQTAEDEPLGRVIIEALQLGVPVVASDSGGHQELLASDAEVCLFPLGDINAAARKIVRFMRGDDATTAILPRLSEEMRRRFSVPNHARLVKVEYERLGIHPAGDSAEKCTPSLAPTQK